MTDRVMVAYPHGEIEPGFHRSLLHLFAYDAVNGQHVVPNGVHLMHETSNIAHGRNYIVRNFLAIPQLDWLWFIDTDMTFEPATLDWLLESADPDERPILGALCFARMRSEYQEILPTLYTVIGDPPTPARVTILPEPGLHQMAMTGTGCLLIHRSVFETIAETKRPGTEKTYGESAFPWFEYGSWVNEEGLADVMGEDLTFCLRAGACGFPVYVDTRIEIGHVKRFVVDEKMYFTEQAKLQEFADIPNFVVMPVKGKQELTEAVIAQLVEQGAVEALLVYDNSDAELDRYEHDNLVDCIDGPVEVVPAEGMSIHQMWNAGIKECLNRAERCNIAILNNDLELGPDFLKSLAKAIRYDDKLAAVSPNYDGRIVNGLVQQVRGIAAGKEDGTGGLAGFAFMVKGEMFSAGFPYFDEQFELWYGDNDFTMNVENMGGWVGITGATSVVHIGGGSQTAGEGGRRLATPQLEAMARRDKKRFEKKWSLKVR